MNNATERTRTPIRALEIMDSGSPAAGTVAVMRRFGGGSFGNTYGGIGAGANAGRLRESKQFQQRLRRSGRMQRERDGRWRRGGYGMPTTPRSRTATRHSAAIQCADHRECTGEPDGTAGPDRPRRRPRTAARRRSQRSAAAHHPNPLDNKLIIQANAEQYQNIFKIFTELDVPPRQILLEAKIYSVTLSDAFTSRRHGQLAKSGGIWVRTSCSGIWPADGRWPHAGTSSDRAVSCCWRFRRTKTASTPSFFPNRA